MTLPLPLGAVAIQAQDLEMENLERLRLSLFSNLGLLAKSSIGELRDSHTAEFFSQSGSMAARAELSGSEPTAARKGSFGAKVWENV